MSSAYYRLSLKFLLIFLIAIGLSACGGDDHFEDIHNADDAQDWIDHEASVHGGEQDFIDHINEFHDGVGLPGEWVEGEFLSIDEFIDQCEVPRTGIDPFTDEAYFDAQGSTLKENGFLRSLTNDVYLWYDEVEDLDPAAYETADYFQLLKTTAITETETPKDQFHWSVNTDEFNAQALTGTSAGYGATFATLSGAPPREVVVVLTLPDTPAAEVSLARGARILSIDGVDVVNDDTTAGVDALNEGLYPSELGVVHSFVVQDLNSVSTRTIEMVSAVITDIPVPIVSTVVTPTGNVGYILFNSHIGVAETGLIDAINDLSAEGVSDLILDLRYNGGGLLDIASELGYMIGGSNTVDKIFENVTFNDKHQTDNPFTGEPLIPVPFHTATFGFSELEGVGLPTLNLDRVFVLAGGNTCSASESLMNSLRGVDVEVIHIGGKTCGKPYGAYLIDNCGTTYFTIQFKGANAKGYGDYADGLFPGVSDSSNEAELPGCEVADDYDHLLGDESEARMSAALAYRENGACPAVQAKGSVQKRLLPVNDGVIRQLRGLGDKILTKGI